jgi:hypothetical protein
MRMSKHIIAMSISQNHFIVDTAGIGGRKKLLPGEVSIAFWKQLRSQQRLY